MNPQGKQSGQSATAILLKKASELFDEGQYQSCMAVYNGILEDSNDSKFHETLLNRASLHLTLKEYKKTIEDSKKYIESNQKQINPQIYVVYLSALIKEGDIKTGMEVFKQANQMFPYHKKIADLGKLCKEKSMTNDDETYVDNMFEKMLMHPKVREYCKEQGFLTKVERMIRNPSLTTALEKMDPRIREAADVMMMADENWH